MKGSATGDTLPTSVLEGSIGGLHDLDRGQGVDRGDQQPFVTGYRTAEVGELVAESLNLIVPRAERFPCGFAATAPGT